MNPAVLTTPCDNVNFANDHPLAGLETQVDQLRQVGGYFHQRGWSLGTSSNYSLVVKRSPLELLVTASGKDKSRLTREDFVRVAADGRPTIDGQPKSSAETMLHVVAAAQPKVGAVLHTHSVWGTILSDLYFERRHVTIEGYEMLKGLSGIKTHETRVDFAILENTQDIASLAEVVRQQLDDPANPLQYGFLMRRHGLYTWGTDLAEALRHIEILEFVFETMGRRLSIRA